MRFTFAAAVFAALMVAGPARADVASSSASSFLIQAEAEVATTPENAWRAVTRPGQWWNGAHTYSGDAANIRVDLRAGGCWCERWGRDQSVEHGRVVMVMEHEGTRTLRYVAPLGPLQELAVNAVLTYTVTPHANGAKITMTYRVSGDPGLNLAEVAPFVDAVLMEQFGRLSRYSASGSPE